MTAEIPRIKDVDEAVGPISPDDRPFLERTETSAGENPLQAAHIQDIDQDREERKKYSSRIYWLVVGWLIAVLAVLMLQGFGQGPGWFKLPNLVLTSLLVGVSVGFIGAFIAVATYLFRKRQ